MSGRKQHFIPQSLLRGFGRQIKKSKIRVVAYTYDRGVFAVATDGVGAERDFYSALSLEPGVDTLDDKITAYEASLADVLASLRETPHNGAADTRVSAELVTHLVVRNDHFRKAASSAASALFDGFGGLLGKESSARTLLGVANDRPSALFREQSNEFWDEYEPLLKAVGLSKAQFEQLSFQAIKSSFGTFHSQISGPLESMFANIVAQTPQVAAKAQRRSLEEALSPPVRAEKLIALTWRIIHATEPLILPDCVAVGIRATGESLPLVFADMNEVAAVCMPLSADRLLVGSRDAVFEPSPVNEASAICSWDFFVAREQSNELDLLQTKLRIGVTQFFEDTVKTVLDEAVDKHSTI